MIVRNYNESMNVLFSVKVNFFYVGWKHIYWKSLTLFRMVKEDKSVTRCTSQKHFKFVFGIFSFILLS
jgi:hypothetical protein